MFEFLYPNEYHNSVKDIDYENLLNKGIKGLLFDIDNTVASYDDLYPDINTLKFFEMLTNMGFKIAFVSNNHKRRVYDYNERLGFTAIYHALKPLTGGAKKAMNLLGIDSSNTALIGDQVFTDVWCGNKLGLYTILVNPILDKDKIIIKIKRLLEKKILSDYGKNK